MSYRYYAFVSFPASARTIPEIDLALREGGDDIDIFGDVIRVSNFGASYGEFDITEALKAHRVPYDHYHSCDCAPDPDPYTVYVRYDANGCTVCREVMNDDQGRANFADEMLELLRAGDLEKLRTKLEEASSAGTTDTIEEIASAWQPQEDAA